MIPPPPRFSLFPYTTLFRSLLVSAARSALARAREEIQAGADPGDLRVRVEAGPESEDHTPELRSLRHTVSRLLIEKKKNRPTTHELQQRLTCAECTLYQPSF